MHKIGLIIESISLQSFDVGCNLLLTIGLKPNFNLCNLHKTLNLPNLLSGVWSNLTLTFKYDLLELNSSNLFESFHLSVSMDYERVLYKLYYLINDHNTVFLISYLKWWQCRYSYHTVLHWTASYR